MRQILTQVYDAILFPSRFVGADVAWTDGSIIRDVVVASRLLGVFGGNLVLYAVPLTLAGFGTVAASDPPPLLTAASASRRGRGTSSSDSSGTRCTSVSRPP